MKIKQLSKDDICIVDLLMEIPALPGSGVGSCFTHAASGEMSERIGRVESLLQHLDAYEVEDADQSLVVRTLERCEGRAVASNPPPPLDSLTIS